MSFSVTTTTREQQQSCYNDIRSVWSIDYWKPDLIHRFRATSNQRKRDAFSMTHVNTILSTVVQFSSFFLSLAAISHMQVLWLHNLTKQYSSTHLDVSAPPGLEDDMSDSISSRAGEREKKMTWKCSNQSNQHNNELYNTWLSHSLVVKMRKSLFSHVWTFLFGVDCNGSIKVTRWLASLFTLEPNAVLNVLVVETYKILDS